MLYTRLDTAASSSALAWPASARPSASVDSAAQRTRRSRGSRAHQLRRRTVFSSRSNADDTDAVPVDALFREVQPVVRSPCDAEWVAEWRWNRKLTQHAGG